MSIAMRVLDGGRVYIFRHQTHPLASIKNGTVSQVELAKHGKTRAFSKRSGTVRPSVNSSILVTPKRREMEKLRQAFQFSSEASARAHATPRSSSIRLGAARRAAQPRLYDFSGAKLELLLYLPACWPLLMALPWSATDFKLNRYRFDIQSESLPFDSKDCAAENGCRKNSNPAPKIL